MKISLNWIARLLKIDAIDVDDETLLNEVIDHLAEIEGIEHGGPDLEGVVVGHVKTCEQHPDADRLSVCSVDVGGDADLSIVCGAPNVAAGQKVAVATIGTTLSMKDKDGQLQSFKIKKSKLRGVKSEGMICAEDELGLGDSHDGIMVFDEQAPIGAPLKMVLPGADRVLDIDNHNINHRPDLWGHLGWARELAIIFKHPVPMQPNISFASDNGKWSVDIQDTHCKTYCGAVVEGVDNRTSPQWMQDVLTSAGVRPLGFLVDVTNYVMLELGEPMHAFDRRQISGEKIIVRSAQDGEVFQTLDEQEHKLQAGDLLIADEEKALALAGIMGGKNSMVQDDTSCIVLEGAIFDAGQIRRTRIRTGLSTDSSNRFEKSLYPCLAPAAINRAIELITEVIPEATVTERFYSGAINMEDRVLSHDPQRARNMIGAEISDEAQAQTLTQLGFEQCDSDWLVPWWRHKDIEASIDFVEEVGRIHGYSQLPAEIPRLPAAVPQTNHLRQSEHRLRRLLSAIGWDEIATYAFTSDEWAEYLQWPSSEIIRLDHPLSSEQTVMRRSLLPTVFEAAMRNRRHFEHIHIYEIGKIYGQGIWRAPCIDERMCIAGMHIAAGNDAPFYTARDAACEALEGLGYTVRFELLKEVPHGADPKRSVGLMVEQQCVGYVCELDQETRKRLKCKDAAAYFHIELEQLIVDGPSIKPIAMVAPSKYQQVDREFTWVCPESLSWDDLCTQVNRAAGKLCRDVDLITVYRGDQIEANHKAVSMRVILQSDDHTLSEKELQKTSKKIISTVEHQTAAKLRG